MKTGILAFYFGSLALAWGAAGNDELGVRRFSKVPSPGVHPRVLFSPEDIPEIKRRLAETRFGRTAAAKIIQTSVSQVRQLDSGFARLDLTRPDRATVEKHFRADEARNQRWGVAALDAALRNDRELKDLMIRLVTNYSVVVLASKELLPRHKVWSGAWNEYGSNWDLNAEWTFGGLGMALGYDVLFNDMTSDQRAIVRKALAAALAGRRSWGMGWPETRTYSNWCPLHGTMLPMALAIEGEPGYDPELYKLWAKLMRDWTNHALYPSGAGYEDGYTFYALRGGSNAMIALARRGDNLFRHPHYQAMLKWSVQFFKPFSLYDGYPAFFAAGRYANPGNPSMNYIWRRYIGEDYTSNLRWQNHVELILFGSDWAGDPAKPPEMAALGLPKAEFHPRRGLMIARNDWSPETLYVQFDARPDAWFSGHDKAERGSFELAGLGRVWAPLGSFHTHLYSTDHSLVHVDGKAEAYKAPAVKFLKYESSEIAAAGAADLKYAYDWQWSPPWPDAKKKFPPPWEPETADPRALGWPGDEPWMPRKLYGEPDFGFSGMWMWRRPYNPVEKAFRTFVMVRGAQPYVLVIDDVRKDDRARLYEWFLQVLPDVELAAVGNADIVLREVGEKLERGKPSPDARRLLVRVLDPSGPLARGARPGTDEQMQVEDPRLEQYQVAILKSGNLLAKRLVIPRRGVAPAFKVLLTPFRAGAALPETNWNADRTQLTVRAGGALDVFTFRMGPDGRTRFLMTRGGVRALAMD